MTGRIWVERRTDCEASFTVFDKREGKRGRKGFTRYPSTHPSNLLPNPLWNIVLFLFRRSINGLSSLKELVGRVIISRRCHNTRYKSSAILLLPCCYSTFMTLLKCFAFCELYPDRARELVTFSAWFELTSARARFVVKFFSFVFLCHLLAEAGGYSSNSTIASWPITLLLVVLLPGPPHLPDIWGVRKCCLVQSLDFFSSMHNLLPSWFLWPVKLLASKFSIFSLTCPLASRFIYPTVYLMSPPWMSNRHHSLNTCR